MKNIYWTVYRNSEVISVAKTEGAAKVKAIDLYIPRATYSSFDKDWDRLLENGFTIKRSIIIPVKSIKEAKELLEEL